MVNGGESVSDVVDHHSGVSAVEDASVARQLHLGRWLSSLLIVCLTLWVAYTVATDPNIDWAAIPQFIFSSAILGGVQVTIELTVLAMVVGLTLGIVLALMRLSRNPVLLVLSNVYLWAFRGSPLLVQIIFWFNIALVFPVVGVPGHSISTNALISPFTAALLALGLNEGAYEAEIVRAGITSIPHGQMDAALTVGLTHGQGMRRIVLPQSIRVILPTFGNQTIGMLKTTALCSVIASQDLLTRAENIYTENFLVIELLIVASIWYLLLTTVATGGEYYLEKRLSSGASRSQGEGGVASAILHQLGRPFNRLFSRG
jgi:polar amino acid transport system permease protein